jgi:uncharacterized membrane protein YjjP (DUF1212 family)
VGEDDAVAFILKLARALHASGYAAHRLEDALGTTARRLGLQAQFFSTPTSILVAIGSETEQRTYLLRVEPADVDLSRLAQLDRLVRRVIAGELSPGEGTREVEAIVSARPRYGPVPATLAFGLVSATAARFLGGGGIEIAVSGAIGVINGLLSLLAGPAPGLGRVFQPLAACVAALVAAAAAAYVAPLSVFVATLAGLIVLLPGFKLTTAMSELATRHLASGTARMADTAVTFLAIIFGVAAGTKIAGAVWGQPAGVEPTALPEWTEGAALVLAPLGFTVLLRAEPRHLLWIELACWIAFAGARLGSRILGPDLGVFLGALAVGAGSNLYALRRDRPSQVPLTPGVLILVPGSVGFRSLASLLDRQVISGIDMAFTMILVATALAAGMLVANEIVPRRTTG